jgi:hypothetical protein
MSPTAVEARAENGSLKDNYTSLDSNLENPSLDYIKSLTNLADIQECLRRLELEETKVDADLDELLAEREDLEASLDKLEVLE